MILKSLSMIPALRAAKRKKVKLPSGRIVWHRVKKKRSFARCGICGKILHGSRRNRGFGNLCSECARRILTERVRRYANQG